MKTGKTFSFMNHMISRIIAFAEKQSLFQHNLFTGKYLITYL